MNINTADLIDRNKIFRYNHFSDTEDREGMNPFIVKQIHDSVYVLTKNADETKYSIYRVNVCGSLDLIFSGDLPESKKASDSWLTDFYVVGG